MNMIDSSKWSVLLPLILAATFALILPAASAPQPGSYGSNRFGAGGGRQQAIGQPPQQYPQLQPQQRPQVQPQQPRQQPSNLAQANQNGNRVAGQPLKVRAQNTPQSRWLKPSLGLNLEGANNPPELRVRSGPEAATSFSHEEPAPGEEEPEAPPAEEEAPPAPEEALKQHPLSMAMDLMKNLGNGRQSMSRDGFNFNNQPTTIKMGNKKKTNVNTITHNINPQIINSHLDRFDLGVGPTMAAPGKGAHVEFNPGQPGNGLEPEKLKATAEQKELKKRLLDLAEKATSTLPAKEEGLLKFNSETEQLEPVAVDPNANIYKQKLQDAIKALSAKKLPVDRLKEALDGLDDLDSQEGAEGEPGPEPVDLAAEEMHADEMAQPEEFDEGDLQDGGEETMEIEMPEEDWEAPPEEEEGAPGEEEEELPAAEEEVDPLQQVREILGDRLARISDLLYFRPEFLNELLQIDDALLMPIEAEFKRMILCNSDEQFCNDDLSKYLNPGEMPAEPLHEDETPPPEEEEEEPFEEPPPAEETTLDDGGLVVESRFPPGARHFSRSQTRYYAYDHAHNDVHFGDDKPVVQSFASANSFASNKPVPRPPAPVPQMGPVKQPSPTAGVPRVRSNVPSSNSKPVVVLQNNRRQPSVQANVSPSWPQQPHHEATVNSNSNNNNNNRPVTVKSTNDFRSLPPMNAPQQAHQASQPSQLATQQPQNQRPQPNSGRLPSPPQHQQPPADYHRNQSQNQILNLNRNQQRPQQYRQPTNQVKNNNNRFKQ